MLLAPDVLLTRFFDGMLKDLGQKSLAECANWQQEFLEPLDCRFLFG